MNRQLRNNFLYPSSEASLSLHLLHHSLPWGEHEKMWTWLLRGWTVLIPCLCPPGDRLPLKILQAPKWIASISHRAQDDRSETHSEDSVSSQTVTTWRRRIAGQCPLPWPSVNARVALLIWEILQTSERSIIKFTFLSLYCFRRSLNTRRRVCFHHLYTSRMCAGWAVSIYCLCHF